MRVFSSILLLAVIFVPGISTSSASPGEPAEGVSIRFQRVVIDRQGPPNPHGKTVADIDGDGYPDVVAASSVDGGMYWYEYPKWAKHPIRTSGGWTTDMQAGDVDRDGDPDVVVPNDAGILWYENPRPGGNPARDRWRQIHIGSQGARAHDVELGDLNRDGRIDVVTRPKGGGATHVWLQETPTSWRLVVASRRPGEGTALGDVDGDGDLDIAHNGFWLENQGSGTSWLEHPIASNWPPEVGVLVRDVNGDGRADVVLAASESAGRLSWYESSRPRTGPWTEHVIDSSISYFHTFKAADVDRDGDLDLVTAEMHQSADPDEVSIYRNDGRGLLWAQQVIGSTGSHNIRIADIGGDGDIDVVGANWNEAAPDRAAITLWRAQPGWGRKVVDAGRPWRAIFIDAADLDGDGRKDIVTGGWWYRNPGTVSGTWIRRAIGAPLNNMAAVFDFDGDGDIDVLGTEGRGSAPNNRFVWARNDGSGEFRIFRNIQTGGDGDFLQGVAVARFRRGGPLRVALSWHNGGGIQMLTVPANPSTETWTWRRVSQTTQSEELSSGDIDRDGDVDLLLGTVWLRNDGADWTPMVLFQTSAPPDRNRLADINDDGRTDAIIGYEAVSRPGVLAWYEQPMSATSPWKEHRIAQIVGPMSLDVADMDRDGDLDVVVGEHNLSSPSSARLWVFLNADGRGGAWTGQVVHKGDEHHDGARVVDIDRDGDPDVVSIGWGHDRVVLYRNRSPRLRT